MDISPDRRRFLGIAAGTVSVAGLGVSAAQAATPGNSVSGSAAFHTAPTAHTAGSSSTTFGPVRQINAGVLSVGYVEVGPSHGQPVILMHGFPYDIHSYVDVAPLLAAQGFRVIVPYFRGYGSTTFLSPATPRHVDQAAFALDVLALMDALKSARRSSPDTTGDRAPPTSSPRCGRIASGLWSR